jgi:ABC-type multidrug transport system fused ATPase/permease subunit
LKINQDKSTKFSKLFILGLKSISTRGKISVCVYTLIGILASIGDGVLIYLVSNWFNTDSINSSSLPNELALIALAFTVAKPLVVILLNSRIFRQLGKEEAKISVDLFRIAVKDQWSNDNPIEEGEFVNLVTNSSSSLVRGIVVRGSIGISVLINLCVIAIALAIVDPITTAVFLLAVGFLLFLTSRIYAKMLSTLSLDKMVAMESVAGLVNISWKIAKILTVMPSKSFEPNYALKRSELGIIGARAEFLSVLPRSLFEVYLGIGLFAAFFAGINNLGSAESFGNLVLYGAVAFRVFPLLSQIQSIGIQMQIERQPAMNALSKLDKNKQIDLVDSVEERYNCDDAVFSTKNLYFSYAKNGHHALRAINIEIKDGEKVAIVGKSGSGKTTLLNVLMGLLDPTNGHISRREIQEIRYGYVPQNSVPCGLPIANSIALEWNANFIDDARIENLISQFNKMTMFHEHQLIATGLDTELSVGQLQSLGLMRALYRSPQILILDEPSSALDETSQKEIMEVAFEQESRTVIMVTHRKETLRYADRILYMRDGQIYLNGEVEEE